MAAPICGLRFLWFISSWYSWWMLVVHYLWSMLINLEIQQLHNIFKFDGRERYLTLELCASLGTRSPQLKLTLKLQPLWQRKWWSLAINFAHRIFGGSLATFVNGSAQFLHIHKIKDICAITNLEAFSFCWTSVWTTPTQKKRMVAAFLRVNIVAEKFTIQPPSLQLPHGLVRLQDSHSRKPAWCWIFSCGHW